MKINIKVKIIPKKQPEKVFPGLIFGIIFFPLKILPKIYEKESNDMTIKKIKIIIFELLVLFKNEKIESKEIKK